MCYWNRNNTHRFIFSNYLMLGSNFSGLISDEQHLKFGSTVLQLYDDRQLFLHCTGMLGVFLLVVTGLQVLAWKGEGWQLCHKECYPTKHRLEPMIMQLLVVHPPTQLCSRSVTMHLLSTKANRNSKDSILELSLIPWQHQLLFESLSF